MKPAGLDRPGTFSYLRKQLEEGAALLDSLIKKPNPVLDALIQDPAKVFGSTPADPWQAEFVRNPGQQTLMVAARQSGKSYAAAALGLWTALCVPESLTIVVAPAQRQAKELYGVHFIGLYNRLGRPIKHVSETGTEIKLQNGSRFVTVPGDDDTVVGYAGVNLLIMDEAARIPDKLYGALRPMLAVKQGKLVAMSTPKGKRGWFYEAWDKGGDEWIRIKRTADQCSRLTPEFLEKERRAMIPAWFEQEYCGVFSDLQDAVFRQDDIEASVIDIEAPKLFLDFG